MIRYPLYFSLHLTGVLLIFMALAVVAFQVWNGQARSEIPKRKLLASMHGVGMFLTFLGGFGLMKVIGLSHGGPYPSYIIIKALIWLILGLGTLMIYKLPKLAPYLLLVFIFLGIVAAYSAKFKRQYFETDYGKTVQIERDRHFSA